MAADTASGHNERMNGMRARPEPARFKARRWHRSPLMRRLLAVNLLALIVLASSLLYLGGYKRELIETELRLIESETRTVAVALGYSSVRLLADGEPNLDMTNATALLVRLVQDSPPGVRMRVRVFDPSGVLWLDSRDLPGSGGAVESEPLPPGGKSDPLDSAWRWAKELFDKIFGELEVRGSYRELEQQTAADYDEVQAALRGETGQAIRSLGSGGLMLSVALPIREFKRVVGAAMVSADGRAIDQVMREVRLSILSAFGVTLVATVLLSAYMWRVIARPLRDLAATAERIRPGFGRVDIQDLSGRNDEIGDLSGALRRMVRALWTGMEETEKFVDDVSHELKKPLASAYSAAETAKRQQNPEKRQQLMQIVLDDVQRLTGLIEVVGDASSLPARFARGEARVVDMQHVLSACIDAEKLPPAALTIESRASFVVHGFEDQLERVVANLIDNARSFSPVYGSVRLSLSRQGAEIVLRVDDDGPGFQTGKEETVFDRFYTDRAESGDTASHSGLGLSMSRDIVGFHGGSIAASNRMDAGGAVLGARIELRLPAAEA